MAVAKYDKANKRITIIIDDVDEANFHDSTSKKSTLLLTGQQGVVQGDVRGNVNLYVVKPKIK